MTTTGPKQCSRCLVALWIAVFIAPYAHADRVQIESAVVESATGTTSAISRSDGEVNTFFTLQKKMVYDTLVGIGISIDNLPPDVRAHLAQFETRNFDAFREFSVGLNAQDEGRFADAKAAYERAIKIDPSFSLAKLKEAAMPAVNLNLKLSDKDAESLSQAVLREAAKNATQAGKDYVAVDVAHALAAMQSGLTVVAGQAPVVQQVVASTLPDSLSNPPGSGNNFGSHSAVGISYTINPSNGSPVGVASTTEWSASQVSVLNNQLVSVGGQANFVARIDGATQSTDPVQTGSATLGDGTKVYWGAWNSVPGASASVTESGVLRSAPQLGPTLHYMFGSSTPAMPATGTVTLLPVGGNFGSASGNIVADFGARQVTLNNLGFTLGNYGFSGLNGQATYANTGSGYFSGNYTSGACPNCPGFSATSSAFTGNFVGKAANGLIFSSIMQTGSGTVSGVHLFKQ